MPKNNGRLSAFIQKKLNVKIGQMKRRETIENKKVVKIKQELQKYEKERRSNLLNIALVK